MAVQIEILEKSMTKFWFKTKSLEYIGAWPYYVILQTTWQLQVQDKEMSLLYSAMPL